MSRIRDVRNSIDKKLDAWERQAQALEAQLTVTRDKALDRLEEHKRQFRDVLSRIDAEVEKSKALADQARTEVRARIEQLRAQLALGKAEVREALEDQRRKILDAVAAFENTADEKLTSTGFDAGRLWEDLVGKASAVEAELEALRLRFELETARQQARLEEKKQELQGKLAAFRDELNTRKQAAQGKAEAIERELAAGLEGIKAAFRHLMK